jgi:NAD(P)-dependent dehydrogenase (short-subunit alcohol dehydrogenase family)
VNYDPHHLPSQAGKTFAVTGGATGIGYFIVEQLACAGASVILLARSEQRADAAMATVRTLAPSAQLSFIPFELGSLKSVSAAALALPPVDGIAFNAGLVHPTKGRELTEDGLERMVGGNYVAHFALLARAFSSLTPQARVVSMGSMSTRLVKADIGDLMQEHGQYNANNAYAYSKHAMQAFGFELDRRLRASGSGIQSLVAHPGFALDVQAPRRGRFRTISAAELLGQNLLRFMTQGKDRGAWNPVRALTDPDAKGGEFYGPRGSVKGRSVLVQSVPQDRDPAFGAELWRLSEQWAQLKFDV